MDINYELYKVFYVVANNKSISKGAEKLMISQPAVTQSIKTLEGELNGKLFVRTPKGVILTNEGYDNYQKIISTLSKLVYDYYANKLQRKKVSSNFLKLMNEVAIIGSDLKLTYSGYGAPSILFKNIAISGK